MKNNIYKNWATLMLLGAIITFTACESYLDEPEPSDAVASTSVFASASGVRAYFNGLYRNLKDRKGPNSTQTTDSRGSHSVLVAGEVKGTDVVNTPESGWFRGHYRHQAANKDLDSRTAGFMWDFYYDFVHQTNILIDGVTNSTLPDSEKAAFIAEAKAIRAWSYFNLVREYAHNVPGNKALPIYVDVTSSDALEGAPRNTVQEVYDLIVLDLTEAVVNLSDARDSKSAINKNVASGILARVYSTMGEWDATAWSKAITSAQDARAGYPINAASYTDQFVDIDSDEWIWGMDQTAEQHSFWGNLASWWDLDWSDGKDGYSNFTITHEFRALFSATDVRNLFALNSARSYPDHNGVPMYGTTKFNLKGDFSEDYVMMRSAEMLLIEAEAQAESGNDAAAATLLFELQSNRDASAVASGNTGTALIDEIMVERRKELYCELGVSYHDAKRKRFPMTRGATHSTAYRFTIMPDDDRLILDIPRSEVDTNPRITE